MTAEAGEPTTTSTAKVRRLSPAFVGALCFAAGLLFASVVVPERQDTNTVAGGSGLGPGDATSIDGGDPATAGTAPEGGAPSGSSGATATTAGSGPGAGPGGGPGASGRGVTDKSIRIGVAYNVTPAALTFSPAFNSGDGTAQFNAILAGWRKSGQLPVNGRDIEFVYRPLDISSPEQQRAACVSLIQDAKVFAVISTQLSQSFNDCVTQEFKTPVLTIELESAASFKRSAPYLFSLQMTVDTALTNLVNVSNGQGLLKGHRIGIYTSDDQQFVEAADLLRKALRSVGVTPAADVTAPAGGTGLASSTDAVAVQRFRSANVDVAFILANRAGFTQQASAQGYEPLYLEADPYAATNDVQTSLVGERTYDGAKARTAFRFGEGPARMPEPPQSVACYKQYNSFAKKDVHRPGADGVTSAEQYQVLYTCDLANAFLAGLKAAGPTLTASSFISGLESVRGLPMAILADVSFSAASHNGTHHTRALTWTQRCTCWTASGNFEPVR